MTLLSPVTTTALIPYQEPAEVLRRSLAAWQKDSVTIYSVPRAAEDQATIVYLKGTACAGKNRFAAAFEKCSKWLCINDDPIACDVFLAAIQERFPKEYLAAARVIHVSNLYHALRYKDILFRQESNEDERKAGGEAVAFIQNELDQAENRPWVLQVNQTVRLQAMQKIETAIRNKQRVLLDSWFFTSKEVQEKFPEGRVIRLLVYCPLPVATKRLFKRNSEGLATGNIIEKRYPVNLLGSFKALFHLEQNPQQPLEVVDKSTLVAAFDLLRDEIAKVDATIPKKSFTIQQLSTPQFETLKKEFLQPFEAYKGKTLTIAPREPQNIIVANTDNLEKVIGTIETALFPG